MQTIIRVSPTLCLRRIAPQQVYERYRLGGFSDVVLPQEKIHVRIPSFTASAVVTGDSLRDQVLSYRDKHNSVQTLVTTDHARYEAFINGTPCPGGTCRYCGYTFTHEPVGIPIKYTKDGDKHIYHVDGCYCGLSCAYSKLREEMSKHRRYRNPAYNQSEPLLKRLHAAFYPGEELCEAKDPQLADVNKGPLTREEYMQDNYSYVPLPSVVLAPCKNIFLRV